MIRNLKRQANRRIVESQSSEMQSPVNVRDNEMIEDAQEVNDDDVDMNQADSEEADANIVDESPAER